MFCFASLRNYRIPERAIAATASALVLGGDRACGYRGADDGVHMWAVTDRMAAARTWRATVNGRGEIVLFYGFLLNRDELLADLVGPDARQLKDEELYARGFEKWRTAAEDHVIGEYAAAVWCGKERTLTLVRSPIMAPPLYYAEKGGDIVVASAPRAIHATGLIERRVDEVKIADSLVLNYMEESRGWFLDISRLPVGTRRVITPTGTRQEAYYDFRNLPEIRLSSDQEYVDTANHLMREGVRRNLDGFRKPAVSMSGGLDSQAVAVFALDVLPESQKLDTYTSVPMKEWDGRINKNRFGDETEHVKALADLYPRINARLVDASGLSFDHKLQAMFMLAEAPPRNAMNFYWMHEVRAQARRDGCDVMLTGAKGNASFSYNGRGYLPTLFRQLRWGKLVRELRAAHEPDRSVMRRLLTRAIFPNLPSWLQTPLYRMKFGGHDAGVPDYSAINADWAEAQGTMMRAVELGLDIDYKGQNSIANRRLAFFSHARSEAGDWQQGLELIHDLPSRDPTAYRPLVEYCFGLPDEQWYRNGVDRFLARRMLNGRLPEMVLNEKRRGAQAADWLVRLEPQREELLRELERLADDPDAARRLDLGKLQDALDDWPDRTPFRNEKQSRVLQLALSRALATERFVRYVEGKN